MNKYLITTFGCKVNTYESQGIKEFLEANSCFESSDNPDFIIINTCAVTSVSERKCLTKVKSYSKRFPSSIIAVLGCSSQLHPERYLDLDNVRVVAGNSDKLKAVESLIFREEKVNLVNSYSREFTYEDDIKIKHFLNGNRAFLKIQDGCDNFCSYCVIPFVRGKSRSRSKGDVLKETSTLFANGYKEIVLTGIDMGSYLDGENYGLGELIEDVLTLTPNGCRIRISSLEMSQITEKIISLFIKHTDRLASHLHIPLQSGSNEILKKMNRRYDLDEFRAKAEYLRKYLPQIGLSTDVIVGFPGETDEHFQQTINYIKTLSFMRIHAFPYSERPFTTATKLASKVCETVKRERILVLQQLSDQLAKEFHDQQVCQKVKVLFEKVGNSHYKGYSENYMEVLLKSDKDISDEIIEVQVTKDGFEY